VGVGLGVGLISASDCGDLCGAGFAGEAHIGGMLNPRTALMFDAWTNIHPVPGTDANTTSTIITGALQLWLNDIIWLKGGLGLGNTQATDVDTNYPTLGLILDANGFAVIGAGGSGLVHYWNLALDLQRRP